jgi:hypothetical protein
VFADIPCVYQAGSLRALALWRIRLLLRGESAIEPKDTTFEQEAATKQQLEYLGRVAGLMRYLEGAEAARLVVPSVATAARQIWATLSAAFDHQLSVPDACPGPDGDLLYTWDRRDDRGDQHFELEIEPGTVPTAFSWNRRTGETWLGDAEESSTDWEEVLSSLRAFLRQQQ